MTFSLLSGKSTNKILINMNLTNKLLFDSMNKLSSGLKINSAADDPAGLVISEQMRARIASLNQEIENTRNMINKYETASSSALQLREMLTEMRTLAVAAANTAVNDDVITRAYQESINSLTETYNNIAANASFGTQKLLDGSPGSVTEIPQLENISLSDEMSIANSIDYIDNQTSNLDTVISRMGATQKNELESSLRNLQIEAQNLTAAESQIRDADMVLEFTDFLRNRMILQTTMSLLSHSFVTFQTTAALLIGK